ncbi:hypothetical protein BH09ACT4_BH09ACT4_25780 [soil metagenome]
MIAFPIPTSEALPPFVGVFFVVVGTAVVVVVVLQAVRYFRRRDGQHDQFGPGREDAKPDDAQPDEERK